MDTFNAAAAGRPGLAISSIFGPPRDPRTWSAAPASLAEEFEHLGFGVVGIDTSVGRMTYAVGGLVHVLFGYGRIRYSEAIARGSLLRRRRAEKLVAALRRSGLSDVLHTGTLDIAVADGMNGVRHFLYCDSTWNLSLRYRPDAALYRPKVRAVFDGLERASYAACAHIFTFGNYVRDDLITHYGVPADRVSAVGSGCGKSAPYLGEKNHGNGEILFVAKHYFEEKGGGLLLDAFRLAIARRPDLHLTIVGGVNGRRPSALPPNITVMPFVSRETLTQLFGRAALLVQPMLNDPWGQIYLEALLARTPVVGLDRNGLPEITDNGRHGFLVREATPEAVAVTILAAVSDPARLAAMGQSGQAYVLENYSWARVAARMAAVSAPGRFPAPLTAWPAPSVPAAVAAQRIPAPAYDGKPVGT